METIKSFKGRVAAMETSRSMKGYGKVDDPTADDQDYRRKSRKRIILIGVASAILLVLLVGAVIGVVANKRGSDGEPSSPAATSTSRAIKAMCKVTRYPDSCFDSVSSVKGAALTTDPVELFKLALGVAGAALTKVKAFAGELLEIPTDDARLKAALRDCGELLDDAVGQVNATLAAMADKKLAGSAVDDMRTWLSAAVADQETCLDGFEGTTPGAREKMEAAMTNSTRYTSNGLAIVAKIMGVMHDLSFPIHRKLLAAPEWATAWQKRALLQTRPAPNVTVAADGTGDVRTITEAVAMVPKKNAYPFVIYVKAGEYKENVVVDKAKWNVVVYGDGMFKTIVAAGLNFVDGTPTFSTATFAAVGKGFVAMDMGFKNTAGAEKHQAVALRAGGDQSIFYRCSFDAFQDTLYAHTNRQFYRECDIAGTVDFIFGDAAVVLQKCTIRPRQPLPNQQDIITAQGRKDPNENTGISIQACTIAPYDTVTAPVYLGRPWKDFSRTVVMQSSIDRVVRADGWLAWVPGTVPPDTIWYGEFQNTGLGADVSGRVTWPGYKPSIAAEEAQKFTVDSFIMGNDWIPQAGVEFGSSL